jgi:hypothetical protein
MQNWGGTRLLRCTAVRTVGIVVAMSIVMAAVGLAQDRRSTVRRTADGRPDLNGVWQVVNAASWNLEAHSAGPGIPAGLSVVEGGTIPYQPWALVQRDKNRASAATADPLGECFLPGVPRVTYLPFPFEIAQTPAGIAMLYEWSRTPRVIPLDGTKHPEGLNFWMGDSRGRWDGETLVVDVANFNDKTWFDRSGNFHSDQLHVVERYTPAGPDSLRYEATITDPKVFTQPWTITMPIYRRAEKDARILEYEMFQKVYAVGAVIQSPFDLDPQSRCLPNGLPRTHALVGPHQILQPAGKIVIIDEQSHQYRSIPLGHRTHLSGDVRLWLGDPVGRWEGNTLIVETTNFNDRTWWDMAASHHSSEQRTIERFTVVDADTINYEITIEDPKVLARPFTGLSTVWKRAPKGDELLEEECLEGVRLENYGFK